MDRGHRPEGALAPLVPDRLAPVLAAALGIVALGAIALAAAGATTAYGGDFAAFWSAGRLTLAGRAADAFDPQIFGALQTAATARAGEVLLWHYPPLWPVLMAPFGALPYSVALLLFGATGLGFWAYAMRILPADLSRNQRIVLALGGAVWICLGQGQNGLWTGALLILAAAAILYGARWRAAVALGLVLAIKPHLALAMLALLAARRDTTALAGSLCIAFLTTAGATAIVGPAYLVALAGDGGGLSTALLGRDLLSQIVSPFAALRLWDVPPQTALAAQVTQAALALAVIWRMARRADARAQISVALLATPMLSPYVFHYDLPVTLAALVLGAPRLGAVTVAALWFAPLFHRPISDLAAVPVMQFVLGMALWRAWRRSR